MANTFEGDLASIDLLESLTKGLDFTIPDVDLMMMDSIFQMEF